MVQGMPRTGRPSKSAETLAPANRKGMRRFSVEMDEDLLARVDAQASQNDRKRNAEIRVLVAEALAKRACT